MKPASVSVVIPAHDAARFLAEAVASVRAQTVPVHEIIVVDDGSTDGTAPLAAELGVRLIGQTQSGASAARHRGAEAATGEWLAFLDADDLWTPTKTAAQLAWMEAHADTDVVFGQGANFSAAADGAWREEPARPAYLPGAVLLRREFYLQHAQFDPAVRLSDAVEWYLRLLDGGVRMGVLPELVLWRRLHDANARRQGDGGHAADLQLLRAHLVRRRAAPR